MKPFLEKLPPSPGSSIAQLNRRLETEIPFQWHHHPELELTLTLNSRGQRFIGDHIGTYDDGDLVLIGPNLPHTWSSVEKIDPSGQHVALVSWVHLDWVKTVAAVMPELDAVSKLFDRAATGLMFSIEASRDVRSLIEAQFTCEPETRLVLFLQVLTRLSGDDAAKPLSSRSVLPQTSGGDRGRIDRLLDHIHLNYAEPMDLESLADLAALSTSGLHRLFRKHFNMTLLDYIIRLRIGQACALLSSTDMQISSVADQVGYQSLANFNRQFKALRGMTPRDYRHRFLRKK